MSSTLLDLDRLRSEPRQGQGFTDSEVTLVVDGDPKLVDVSVVTIDESSPHLILMELRKIDHKNASARNYSNMPSSWQHETWCAAWRTRSKTRWVALRGAAQLLEKALPDAQLKEYTGIIIAQADRLRNLRIDYSGRSDLAATRCTMFTP